MSKRKIIAASELNTKKAEWLWYPYIPFNCVTILHGNTASGKTQLLMKLMAACTEKVKIDNDKKYLNKYPVLYMTDEKDLEKMVLPKLEEAGAKKDDIYFINDGLRLSLNDDALEKEILERNIRLLVIDSFTNYLDTPKDMVENPEKVIPIIIMLEHLAEYTGCAVVISFEAPGLDDDLVEQWRRVFESHIASYLSMDWIEKMDLDERTLFHERSLLAPEGSPVDYKFTTSGGLVPRTFL